MQKNDAPFWISSSSCTLKLGNWERKDGLTCTIKASFELQPGEQRFAVLHQLAVRGRYA